MNVLRRIDRFGEPIPAFNIKGKDKVTTAVGGIMTLTVMFFTLSYLITKINSIVEKKNPIMNENKIQDYYGTVKDGVRLNEAN